MNNEIYYLHMKIILSAKMKELMEKNLKHNF